MRIAIVSASIGGGHDGVARELARRLRCSGYGVDCHDFVTLWPAGRLLKAGYARQLRVAPRTWGWLLSTLARWRPLARLTAAGITAGAGPRLRRALGEPIVVVSTYPLASQALGRLRRRGELTVPVVTFLTDMSVHPLWVAPLVGTHLALHPVAAAQAEALGAHGVRVTGPAVGPAFRPASGAEQRAARARFGLPERTPLALVVAGAWGVGEIATTAAEVAAAGVVTPVVACGHNEDLRASIAAEGTAVAVGWTDGMAELIRACDVVVQNAGGLSCLEALACGVPVLSYRCLPGHGRTNAAALEQAGWIPWIREPGELAAALKSALTEQSEPPAPVPADPAAEVLAAFVGWDR